MTKSDALLNRVLAELGRIALMTRPEEIGAAPSANTSVRLNLTLPRSPGDMHVLSRSVSFATRNNEPIFCAQWQIGLETMSGFAQRKLRLQLVSSQAGGTKETALRTSSEV